MDIIKNQRIALFLATSGHSGVDKIAKNLVPALVRRGYQVDILKIQGHGPHLEELPLGARIIDLGTSHVYSAVPAIVRYLKRERPAVLLADKYRVIHTAYFAKIRKLPCQVDSCKVEFSACFDRNSDGVRSPKES